jgi:hypothetical protein
MPPEQYTGVDSVQLLDVNFSVDEQIFIVLGISSLYKSNRIRAIVLDLAMFVLVHVEVTPGLLCQGVRVCRAWLRTSTYGVQIVS